jgi:hypothetical protein
MMTNDYISQSCGKSKDLAKVRFAFMRISLDELFEPVLYRCESLEAIIKETIGKYVETIRLIEVAVEKTIDLMVVLVSVLRGGTKHIGLE